MNKSELIQTFKKSCESEKIQLDNLDWAWLCFNDNGEVIVKNEHGTEFSVSELSKSELEVFDFIFNG